MAGGAEPTHTCRHCGSLIRRNDGGVLVTYLTGDLKCPKSPTGRHSITR